MLGSTKNPSVLEQHSVILIAISALEINYSLFTLRNWGLNRATNANLPTGIVTGSSSWGGITSYQHTPYQRCLRLVSFTDDSA